ncbi:MAG: hypothetical protein IPI46_14820 [Bacteroidetes bacterium]|nr:hypothetical protein [Bacteroidota bacterium]
MPHILLIILIDRASAKESIQAYANRPSDDIDFKNLFVYVVYRLRHNVYRNCQTISM